MDSPASLIKDKLSRIKLLKVDVIFSPTRAALVTETNATIRKALWPRVTIELDGKIKRFALKTTVERREHVQEAVLSFLRKGPISLTGSESSALREVVNDFYSRTMAIVGNAATSKTYREKAEAEARKKRRLEAMAALQRVMTQHYKNLRRPDVLAAWKAVDDLETIRLVLDS